MRCQRIYIECKIHRFCIKMCSVSVSRCRCWCQCTVQANATKLSIWTDNSMTSMASNSGKMYSNKSLASIAQSTRTKRSKEKNWMLEKSVWLERTMHTTEPGGNDEVSHVHSVLSNWNSVRACWSTTTGIGKGTAAMERAQKARQRNSTGEKMKWTLKNVYPFHIHPVYLATIPQFHNPHTIINFSLLPFRICRSPFGSSSTILFNLLCVQRT